MPTAGSFRNCILCFSLAERHPCWRSSWFQWASCGLAWRFRPSGKNNTLVPLTQARRLISSKRCLSQDSCPPNLNIWNNYQSLVLFVGVFSFKPPGFSGFLYECKTPGLKSAFKHEIACRSHPEKSLSWKNNHDLDNPNVMGWCPRCFHGVDLPISVNSHELSVYQTQTIWTPVFWMFFYVIIVHIPIVT